MMMCGSAIHRNSLLMIYLPFIPSSALSKRQKAQLAKAEDKKLRLLFLFFVEIACEAR